MIQKYPVNITFNIISDKYIDNDGCHNTVYQEISIKGYKSNLQDLAGSNHEDWKAVMGALFTSLFKDYPLEEIKELSSNKKLIDQFYKSLEGLDLFEELRTDYKEGQQYLEHNYVRVIQGIPAYIRYKDWDIIKDRLQNFLDSLK